MVDHAPADSENSRATMDKRRHWLGLPVTKPVEGTMNEVLQSVPHFGRQPFSMASLNGNEVGVNPFLDMVYRVASKQDQDSIPVGVVSKNYRLVDHHHALRTVQDVLTENQIDMSEVLMRGEWTIHGERTRFSLILPDEDRSRCSWGAAMTCASGLRSLILSRGAAASWRSRDGFASYVPTV
jgi:hypothetical protein